MGVTANDILRVARGWIGFSEANGKFKTILNIYNSHKPLARGYAIQPTDEWCDAFVSAVAIKAGAVGLIGTEVGCERHIDIFKKKGIWNENGSMTPKAGDIILYNWDSAIQPNNGSADHIGIVEKVSNNKITVIEGNYSTTGAVARRVIPVGWGYIRGYARPKYAKKAAASSGSTKKTITAIAKEVIAGKWGSGELREKKLKKAGYNYDAVQKKVNELLKTGSKKSIDEIAKEVIAGKWGNGSDRKNRLIEAGYDFEKVQKRVSELL